MLRITVCCVFLLFVLLTLTKNRRAADGHLIYALDGPYIHLALSDEIAHGHYGINSTEFWSPASSTLWPFLLAPFAGRAVHPCVPLLVSIGAGLIAAWLLAVFVDRRVLHPHDMTVQFVRLALVVLLCLTAPAGASRSTAQRPRRPKRFSPNCGSSSRAYAQARRSHSPIPCRHRERPQLRQSPS
jgi:hypothetical protein